LISQLAGMAEHVCTKHLLRLNRRQTVVPAQDANPHVELAALETNPFPLAVLFKQMAHGQLESGSGEGQARTESLLEFAMRLFPTALPA